MPLQDLTPQLRTRLRRVEKMVSLFVVFATLLLMAGFLYYLYHTAARRGWFIPKCRYHTYAQSGEGLKVGDPVTLMGFDVGEITEITAQPPGSWYKVFIGFNVRRPYYGYVWSDSKVKIAAAGLLGARRLELLAGYDGMPTAYETGGELTEVLVDGRRVPVAQAPKGVFVPPVEEPAMSERAQQLLGIVEAALPNVLAITNPANDALRNVASLTAQATLLTSNVNTLVVQAQPILEDAAMIVSNLTDPHGSLGEWVIPRDTKLALNTNLVALASSLNDTLLNLAAITSNLNAQVAANDQILSEISALIRNTDDMVQGLKRHWLLRGLFRQTATNAPPVRPQADRPAPKPIVPARPAGAEPQS